MTPPRVSAIIIFLNGEAYLDEAIASVLTQTMSDLELLLCDDGSTDGSTAIAQGWVARDPSRVRYLEHAGHVNRGMSATRNLGIAAARGEFIAFLDADDVWAPEKLADQVRIMELHPELGMVCGTVNYWRSWGGGEDTIVPTGHVQDRVVQPPEASLALYPLGTAAAPCPSDMLLRREAVEAVGGFEEHFTGPRQMYEDQGFLAKLYLDWPVYFASPVWLQYRQHPGSWVAMVTIEGLYDEVRAYFLAWFSGYLDGRPDAPPSVRAALLRATRSHRRSRSPAGRAVRRARASARRVASGLKRRAVRVVRSRSTPAGDLQDPQDSGDLRDPQD